LTLDTAGTRDGTGCCRSILGEGHLGPLQRRRAEGRRHDVVFYTPWIGSILSARASPPPGGAETQVLLLARALARRGLRVAIIVFGNAAELPAQVEGVAIVARPGYKKPRGLLQKFAEIIRIWRSLWRAPSHTIVYRTATHELGLLAIYAVVARRRLIFSSAHVVDFEYHKLETRCLYRVMYQIGARLAHAIVVQTEEQVELCKAAFHRTPTLIKSIAPLAPRRDDEPAAFLWVGRLVPYKRPLDYVALARALPEAKFWIIGVPSPAARPDDRLLAEEVMEETRNVSNLQLLPPRSHRELGALMSRAVASVNTADFEGMPNVLLEAWSRGIPALVLNHDPGGVVEAHRLGGFARGSPEKLVELAREQWVRRYDRQELSERCRRYVQTHHAPEIVSERWHRLVSVSNVGPPLPVAEVEPACVA
jgi:glycosyltransferase involved in cell wall biosynthesis